MKLKKRLKSVKVVKGAGRGKKLGVPTINLDPSVLLESPPARKLKEGIYVCRVFLPKKYWGVMHFGPRPVFGELEKTLEIHLFDFESIRQVPEQIDLEIYKYIREIMNFDDSSKLISQIKDDIKIAKAFITSIA